MKSVPPGRKILIVDDEPSFRSTLALLLRTQRWEVVEACDSQDAMEKVKARQPDILLLDQRMPGLSGTEFYRRLRDQGIHVPAVLMTAAGNSRQLARAAHISHFLQKPFEWQELTHLLEQAAQENARSQMRSDPP